jgi:cell division protein FtsI/penicillin-binding protein 2
MLKGVVEAGGTAAEVSVPNYTLAGKTGTAEKAEDGGYSETRYVASFVGFAPADNPQLVIAVLVDEPKYETSGGKVAAPVVADIASFALPYLGIAPG